MREAWNARRARCVRNPPASVTGGGRVHDEVSARPLESEGRHRELPTDIHKEPVMTNRSRKSGSGRQMGSNESQDKSSRTPNEVCPTDKSEGSQISSPSEDYDEEEEE
jgi:hypothetical protein